jgi:hypothetical protein
MKCTQLAEGHRAVCGICRTRGPIALYAAIAVDEAVYKQWKTIGPGILCPVCVEKARKALLRKDSI